MKKAEVTAVKVMLRCPHCDRRVVERAANLIPNVYITCPACLNRYRMPRKIDYPAPLMVSK